MATVANITPQIIDRLYLDALVLSDEVRSAFAWHAPRTGKDETDLASEVIAIEALLATSRMMNATAWLINHRAFFKGELTERQFRECEPLTSTSDQEVSDSFELLPATLQELVHATEEFHSRLLRLEQA